MKQSEFNILLAILGAIILILPFTGKVFDGRKKWFQKFKWRGWVVILFSIFTVFVTHFKDKQAERDDTLKAMEFERQKKIDDSLANKRNDERTAEVIKTFTSSLAQYGLRFDSTNRQITKQIEAVKSKNDTKPEMSILIQKSLEPDTSKYEFIINAKQSTMYDVNLKAYLVRREKENKLQFEGLFRNFKFQKIVLEEGIVIYFSIFEKSAINYYFLIKGNYKNSDNKRYNYSDIISYNTITNQTQYLTEKEMIWLKEFYGQNRVIF